MDPNAHAVLESTLPAFTFSQALDAVSSPRSPSPAHLSSPTGSDDHESQVSCYGDVEEPDTYKYDLRQTVRVGRAAVFTWLDADESGDYDPSNRKSSKKGKSARLVPMTRHTALGTEADEGEEAAFEIRVVQLSSHAARQRGCSAVVSFKIKRSDIKELTERIPQNWPGEYYNILSDEYIEQQSREILKAHLSSYKPYCLRNRSDPMLLADDENDEDSPTDTGIADPLGDEVDLSNHPVARGCAECRKFQLQCTLIDEGQKWPCTTCKEDSSDCTLLTPARKAACDHCRRNGMARSCSYIASSDFTKPCDQCEASRSPCVAAPDPTALRERNTYERIDQEKRLNAARKRRYIQCTECRTRRVTCSLKKKTDVPPCSFCDQNGVECTFLPLRKASSKKSSKSSKASDSQQSVAENAQIAPSVKTIYTSLCHPISFLMMPEECHWCANPAYGILGLGWVDPLVLPSDDNLQYTELRDGHRAQGSEPSRMCIDCCISRIAIINCPEHELRPVDGIRTRDGSPSNGLPSSDDLDLDDFDFQASFSRLMTNTVLPTDRWCHICPNVALYQCCTPQEEDKFGDPWDPMSDEAQGCGLFLCEACAMTLNEEGSLDAVIDRIQEAQNGGPEQDKWFMGQRADAEFFTTTDNLLMRKVTEGLVDEMDVD
ncbi:hypothetical protein EJ08DRAFT_89113 [Tothia fuscella]|uniref:Zn(2)-C6 fungal-type domain-containing protein n=1 Tax=Tothia fuscella TaxID=1048955 RepID=A0A9P4NVK6_9PEZI|nr:hypothetical protein EJ08DRAFT_89113 [Tothia fuscella]